MGDRLTGALEAFIRRVMARVDHFALYPAQVAKQNADGTLELQPEDARLPGVSKVPIRYGVPGMRATVAAGARVLLGFEGGDPQRPFASLFERGTVTKLEIDGTEIVLNGGAAAVAREGDSVQVSIPIGTVLVPSPTTPFFAPNAAPISLDGNVTSGAAGVKA